MEYLQYLIRDEKETMDLLSGFKPCYKWNTFNTEEAQSAISEQIAGFKPCYKWNTFNTILKRFL